MFEQFSAGARYLLTGLRLLRHRQTLPFVIGPILINVLLFYFGLSWLSDSFGAWLDGMMAAIPEWLSFIRNILWVLFIALLLIAVAYSFTFVATLIGAPFYGLLSEQVQLILSGSAHDSELSFKRLVAIAGRSVLREIQKMLHYLRWVIPLLLLSLLSLIIAPLAPLMPFIWFGFGAWMLAIEYVDYAYDNNERSFSEVRAGLAAQRGTALGFGSITTLASMVPLLNIIVVPAAVCGGTALYCEKLAANGQAGNR